MAIRIPGLVEAARQCREILAQGVPPSEGGAFLGGVRKFRDAVVEVCRGKGRGIDALPGPSREAFRFLDQVARTAPEELFTRETGGKKALRLRVPGLLSFLEEMLLDHALGAGPSFSTGEWEKLAGERVGRVRSFLESRGLDPSFLPLRTGRAFAWLEWLRRGGNLEEYREVLRGVLPRLEAVTSARWGKRARPVGALFEPGRNIFRAAWKGDLFLWRIHCGFLRAGEEEWEDLLQVALLGKRAGKETLQRHKSFLHSPRFLSLPREIDQVLEGPGRDRPKGRARDLGRLFDRINEEYFEGRLGKPRLTWGRRITRRRLGTFDPLEAKITLSPLLDDPAVPEYVTAYILYHEMLHLARPGRVRNGRLLVHTGEFKRLEDRFREKEEARRWIERLSRVKEAGTHG